MSLAGVKLEGSGSLVHVLSSYREVGVWWMFCQVSGSLLDVLSS